MQESFAGGTQVGDRLGYLTPKPTDQQFSAMTKLTMLDDIHLDCQRYHRACDSKIRVAGTDQIHGLLCQAFAFD
jgi:hypothetical protein